MESSTRGSRGSTRGCHVDFRFMDAAPFDRLDAGGLLRPLATMTYREKGRRTVQRSGRRSRSGTETEPPTRECEIGRRDCPLAPRIAVSCSEGMGDTARCEGHGPTLQPSDDPRVAGPNLRSIALPSREATRRARSPAAPVTPGHKGHHAWSIHSKGRSGIMSDAKRSFDVGTAPSAFERTIGVCDQYEAAWRAGLTLRIEDYLDRIPVRNGRRCCASCCRWSWSCGGPAATGQVLRSIGPASPSTPRSSTPPSPRDDPQQTGPPTSPR